MPDSLVNRVVAEAALAKRFENEINKRASSADIPTLVDEAKNYDLIDDPPYEPPDAPAPPIAFDTDGVPYLTIGDES